MKWYAIAHFVLLVLNHNGLGFFDFNEQEKNSREIHVFKCFTMNCQPWQWMISTDLTNKISQLLRAIFRLSIATFLVYMLKWLTDKLTKYQHLAGVDFHSLFYLANRANMCNHIQYTVQLTHGWIETMTVEPLRHDDLVETWTLNAPLLYKLHLLCKATPVMDIST